MSTSLSRQLQQLRAEAPQVWTATQAAHSVAGKGPSILSDPESVPLNQVRVLAERSFKHCVKLCPEIEKLQPVLFNDDKDEEPRATLVSDALLLLSPHLMTSQAQFMLQFLLTEHRVHVSHPELLLLAALPHFTSALFHRIVDQVFRQTPSKSSYPNWMESFRAACHPATKKGLYKHVVSDRGFLKLISESMVEAQLHQVRYPAASYEGLTYFFAMTILEALESIPSLHQDQVLTLLHVIFSCLSSNHKEFHALGATLLARIYPRVTLNAKAANQTLKVLRKASKGRIDRAALALLLIVIKTQHKTIDKEKSIATLAKFERPFEEVLEQKDVDYICKITHTLSLFLETGCLEEINFSGNINTLLVLLKRCLESSDTTLATARSLHQKLQLASTRLKKVKKSIAQDLKPELKNAISNIKLIFCILTIAYPELAGTLHREQLGAEQAKQNKPEPKDVAMEVDPPPQLPSEYSVELETVRSIHHAIEGSKSAVNNFVSFKSDKLIPVLGAALSEHDKIKKTAFKIIKVALEKGTSTQSYLPLLSHLLEHKSEIISNSSNITMVMQTFLEHKENSVMFGALLGLVIDCKDVSEFCRMVPYFKPLKTKADVGALTAYASALLKKISASSDYSAQGRALYILLEAFVAVLLRHIEDNACWSFLQECLDSRITLSFENQVETVAVLVLKGMSKAHFKGNTIKIFKALLELTIKPDIDGNTLFESKNVIEHLNLTTEDYLEELKAIWGESYLENRVQEMQRSSRRGHVDEEAAWKKTFFLLEVFLCEKEPSHLEEILGPLFALLHLSTAKGENENYNNVYALDLLLSAIHFALDHLKPEEIANLRKSSINPDLLVQCIRQCCNPDTNNTALLILAKASAYNTDYVLQNSIQIFTFMGSHFLKMESKHSFDVACQAIDIIIPHVTQVCKKKGMRELQTTCLNIITTFVNASADMASHRFQTFMHKLVVCLGEKDYLWILVLLLLKSVYGKKGSVAKPEKLKQIESLYATFSLQTQLKGLLGMLVNLKNDNMEMRDILKVKAREEANEMDLKHATNPVDEYDLLRLKMLGFVANHLSSNAFAAQVEESLHTDNKIESLIELVVNCAIINIDLFRTQSKTSRIRKFLLLHSEKVLENALGILSVKNLISLLARLLRSPHESVRRRLLEVFNGKMQSSSAAPDLVSEQSLATLVKPLLSIAEGTIPETKEQESERNQQLALLSIRSFAKAAGNTCLEEVKEVCKKLCKKSFLHNLSNPNIEACVLPCLADLFHTIGPHAVAHLPTFVKFLLKLMAEKKSILGDHAILLNSIILTVCKLMESFRGFLNPYFGQFMLTTCQLSALHMSQSEGTAKRHMANRMKHLEQAMATGIPTHSLLSICQECFDELSDSPDCISALMDILKGNVESLDKMQAHAMSASFVDFFFHAFLYRQRLVEQGHDVDDKGIHEVESKIIEGFLALTMKLSLDDFKPLFFRVLNLFFKAGNNVSNVTIFHIILEVAKRLKSLFEFSCETVLQKATTALNFYVARDAAALKSPNFSTKIFATLAKVLLEALATIFLFNQMDKMLTKTYEGVVAALLALFNIDLPDKDMEPMLEQLSECVVNLAAHTEDETPWRHLNYQVLLFLRSPSPKIRMCVLKVIGKFLEHKGDTYRAVFPDAVPFLYETFEDEIPEIELASKDLLRKMEDAFGESLESYFN